jgi:hypothetical protein
VGTILHITNYKPNAPDINPGRKIIKDWRYIDPVLKMKI